jgi:transcriptional regulator with XRE-family HTH domain
MVHLKVVLASNIRARRKDMGMTQESLAEKVNTASTYIAMIEAGKRNPSFRMIERIAEVLRVEAPALFAMKNYPSESSSQIRDDLMDRFDQFLRAAVNEAAGESKRGEHPLSPENGPLTRPKPCGGYSFK